MQDKSYNRAIKLYNVLESTYPYGVYAQQGLLELSYTYYQDNQTELAIPTIDQFIKTYPTNSNMDYALYLKGFINYKIDNGLFASFTRQDMSERDSKNIEEAYAAFSQLIQSYPNSEFVKDARIKNDLIVNMMARSEIYRARYYMNIKAYLAAINRAQNVIINYSQTSFLEEALAMQVFAYNQLSEKDLAKSTLDILRLNFPNSKYLYTNWQADEIPWYAIWR